MKKAMKTNGVLLSVTLLAFAFTAASAEPSGDTPVYYTGGKRGHIKGCSRLKEEPNTTYAEMRAKGGLLCSRCPGSTTPGKGNPQGGDKGKKKPGKKDDGYGKYGRKGAKARKAWLQVPAKEYDPNTKAYCDALWMRVHEGDCPMLVLKDKKKVITLGQADKEGWRIGETGQSGRGRCCFKGYRRKHPEKDITDDTFGIVQIMKGGERHKFHQAGCHRFTVQRDNKPMTRREATALPGYYMCSHCLERGPSVTSVTPEGLAKMPVAKEFVPPEGWTRKPIPADALPPQKDVDILVEEMLCGREVTATPYKDPLAMLEEFMGRRFFFGYSGVYKLYRATGDKRLLDKLLQSARYYHNICVKYPGVAKVKARDPEHMNYLFPMAGWSRITLQLARKFPDKVTQKEIAEAEAMLKAIVAALKETCEGDTGLDPKMGIPQKLADDFRRRAFNRAANGVGTLATASKALEDLQVVKKTKAYQPTIDRYRKCVQGWVKTWKKFGCLYTEPDGLKYFYYPYAPRELPRNEDGLMTGGADDAGHYQYSVSGATLIFEATPELGCDDEFMTAMANAVHHNSGTKNGSIQCPSADKIKPVSRHAWSPGPKTGFYMLHAFRDGLIDAMCQNISEAKKVELNSEIGRVRGKRLLTMHGHYLKALRKDRTLIHLGEMK